MINLSKVTIGIPFYNAESTLLSAMQSVFAQTYEDWELILFDDGSKDRSLSIAESISDTRVRVIHDGQNKGLSYRLNQLSRLATGKYLARMDSDDLMHPERINRQVEYLESHPQVDLVGTGVYVINEHNKVTGLRAQQPLDCNPKTVLSSGLFIHPSVMGQTRWFREHPYDEFYVRAEDHELWVRTVKCSTFAKIELPLFFYRENSKLNLRNYLSTCRTDRIIFKQYGPDIVGERNTNVLIVKSYIKGFIFALFHRFSKDHVLSSRRNSSVPECELGMAEQTLKLILSLEIP